MGILRKGVGILFSLCLLFLMTLLGCGGSSARPNLIVITLESLRADHVGCYGYPIETTPNLDRFAEAAIRYEDAHSVTSWTLPSHVSLLTGLYPSAAQVVLASDRLDDSYTTAAEMLSAQGYGCSAFVSGPYLRRAFNLDQGFRLYDDQPSSVRNSDAHGDVTNPEMEKKLTDFFRSSPEQPFFLFAYLWDIHYDYIPPPPFDTLFVEPGMEPFDVTVFRANSEIHAGMDPAKLRYLISQYDGEIRATDELLGRLFEEIRSAGLWEKTAIVIVADHGEEFFDHGQKGHKHNLHVESARVPLFVKPAGENEGRVDGRLAGLVDLLPTMLDLCGLPEERSLPGRSLIAPVGNAPAERFLELVRYSRRLNKGDDPLEELDFHSWAVRSGDYKYMRLSKVEEERLDYYMRAGRENGERLYCLPEDPGEERDLSEALPEIAESLRERAIRWREEMGIVAKQYGGGGSAELTTEEEERLRALGYIE